jgi:hypothetical protein
MLPQITNGGTKLQVVYFSKQVLKGNCLILNPVLSPANSESLDGDCVRNYSTSFRIHRSWDFDYQALLSQLNQGCSSRSHKAESCAILLNGMFFKAAFQLPLSILKCVTDNDPCFLLKRLFGFSETYLTLKTYWCICYYFFYSCPGSRNVKLPIFLGKIHFKEKKIT